MSSSGKIFRIILKESSKEENNEREDSKNETFQFPKHMICRNGLQLIGILGVSLSAVSFLILIPRHNSILEPEHWFEMLLPAAAGCLLASSMMILSCSILTETNYFVSTQFILKIFLLRFLIWATFYCICYIVWTGFLEYNHPMPFLGLISYYPMAQISLQSFFLLLHMKFVGF